jgi:AraC-like DNA-binding protein
LRLDIDPAEITALIADAGPMGVPTRPTGRGLYVESSTARCSTRCCVWRDCWTRRKTCHARATDSPGDSLSPAAQPQGHRLYEIAIANSQSHRISQAIKWLNGNFEQPLRIDDLAKEVNLSVSTLHHRFKAMTAMSPLQYQKQLRLQEARRLMLAEGLEASAAGYRVGMKARRSSAASTAVCLARRRCRDLARLRQSV